MLNIREDEMSVSVVIPTYGRSRDLAKLFETILVQTVKPMEIIVVDDSPTDEIECLCGEATHRFKISGVELIYIRNPRERSIPSARNVGAEKAKGDILIFLDSDIILHPNYIEEILKVFKRYDRALGVQGWHVNITRKELRYQLIGKIFKLEEYSVNSCKYGEYPRILTKIIPCENLRGSNMAIKRRVFEEGFHFDENLKGYAFMEDLLFSHSIFKKYPGSLYITPYAKCQHKRSSGGKNRKQLNTCRKYVLTTLFGWRGLLLYYRQKLGVFIAEMFKRLYFNR